MKHPSLITYIVLYNKPFKSIILENILEITPSPSKEQNQLHSTTISTPTKTARQDQFLTCRMIPPTILYYGRSSIDDRYFVRRPVTPSMHARSQNFQHTSYIILRGPLRIPSGGGTALVLVHAMQRNQG